MLSILNQYAHGYIAVPVILACKKGGFFEQMAVSGRTARFSDLVQTLHANPGHLRVALRMFESLRWVKRTVGTDDYELTAQADIHAEIPDEVADLLTFRFSDYLDPGCEELLSIRLYVELSRRRWGTGEALAVFLDGLIVIPLLLKLRARGLLDGTWKDAVPLAAADEIQQFFFDMGWSQQAHGSFVLTQAGRFMAERIPVTAVVASYLPMLLQMDQLLFGLCRTAFSNLPSGVETHVDRTLNVIGSGFQHQKYFDDMEALILSIFDRLPFESQPRYIADTGCGDGTLLKKLFDVVRSRSVRGRVLDQYPLGLIGIDFNAAALAQTANTLAGLEHVLIKGDIGDPEQVVADIRRNGITDSERILHVRSFLDHDRPYKPPQDEQAILRRSHLRLDPSAVSPGGDELDPGALYQSLVEHLRRWSGVMTPHGLAVLEVHCLEPEIVSQHLDSESLHFDAYHAFSGQLLVKAERFLMAAAEAGLFPQPRFARKYPKTLDFARITLSLFEPRAYTVRPCRPDDLAALIELEAQCWAPEIRATEEMLANRLQTHPEDQLVLEVSGKVAGCIYSQRIESEAAVHGSTMASVEALHRPDGAVVQLLAISISPQMQDLQLGDQLLELMLHRCSLMNGVRKVVGVTRCKDFANRPDLTLDEYIVLRNEQGRLVDPILGFHESHGAQVGPLVANYRPLDRVNQGQGVFIEYDLIDRKPPTQDPPKIDAPVQVRSRSHANAAGYVDRIVRRLLSLAKTDELQVDRPLMELGLDSADLLELSRNLKTEFGAELSPVFFFEHNTCRKIIEYLNPPTQAAGEPLPAVAASGAAGGAQQAESPARGRGRGAAREATTAGGDVAVVGASCRLPGGIRAPHELWKLLIEGRDAVGVPASLRWQWPGGIEPAGKHAGIDHAAYLEDIMRFDAGFFRISPREAELMDPQQRLLLELSWECLEDAGLRAAAVAGTRTGVYVGASGSDYRRVVERALDAVDAHVGIGSAMSVIPNRISYFYDFRGPSLHIDTACSSSLVAVSVAMDALNSDACDTALVAGVNVICDPVNTISYYQAGMLSREGRCRTFDAAAGGYVRGEGAVVLMLKLLDKAQRDGDRIHAVLKASAVNHGGQAGGLTVPNPAQQARLLIDAYTKAGVQPQTVSYIEAHGTGTPLGDPIEVRGLKQAFAMLAGEGGSPSAHCGLGSIKTNIGHLEAAAGIAGLLKVILSMQHQQMPALLNFSALNPQIELRDSPFFIVERATPWARLGPWPRRAGVSSFGSGGTNAHVVVEEYVATSRADAGTREHDDAAASERPALIVLSAKTREQLSQRVRQLHQAIESHGLSDADMPGLAYTLQSGRDAMEHRLATTAASMHDLQRKLALHVAGEDVEELFVGDVKSHGEALSLLAGDEDAAGLLGVWLRKGKYTTALQMWVKGMSIDWRTLYGERTPQRIGLPTYPFAGVAHWVTGSRRESADTLPAVAQLHPLLHQNTSDLSGPRYSAVFTGEEFFLHDHRVQGRKVLPGVAHLEMARAAVAQACRQETAGATIRIRNVVWTWPVVVDDSPVQVHIGLSSQAAGIAYEIYSERPGEEAGAVVYSQGMAEWMAPAPEPRLDLPAFQARCTRHLSAPQCYELFGRLGLAYGRGFQAIQQLSMDPDQVLAVARLDLPKSVIGRQREYVLHPSMLDAALQAAVGLMIGPQDGEGSAALPFALAAVEVLAPCSERMWAVVRSSAADEHANRRDIDVCDEDGTVCVRMTGLTLRAAGGKIRSGKTEAIDTLLLRRRWQEQPITDTLSVLSHHGKHLVILCGIDGIGARDLAARMPDVRCEAVGGQGDVVLQFDACMRSVFGMVQDVLRTKPTDPVLVQVVVPAFGAFQGLSGLAGFLKSGRQENARLLGQVIAIDEDEAVDSLADKLLANCHPATEVCIRYADGTRQVERWEEIEPRRAETEPDMPWRDGGVYLITGGAGGLGLIFAREIAHRTKASRLVLVGRSAGSASIEAGLDELNGLGAQASYQSVDIADAQAVGALIAGILKDHGRLNGILHSAGVIRDSLLVNKTQGECDAVLAPKVRGLVNLDAASKDVELDCFICFSSIAGALGNIGQGDYAACNAFMDAYAGYRNSLVVLEQRRGRTLAINWPLWEEGGMRLDAAARSRMSQQAGMTAIQTDRGIEALYRAWESKEDQVLVLEGWRPRLQAMLAGLSSVAPVGVAKAPPAASLDTNLLLDKVRTMLIRVVSRLLKVNPQDIDDDAELSEFGFDSMLFTEFGNRLNEDYRLALTPALFFEYRSLSGIAGYLVKEHAAVLAASFAMPAVAMASEAAAERPLDEEEGAPVRRRRSGFAASVSHAASGPFEPPAPSEHIAIVGMSCQFPMAEDTQQFWENLVQERDCIREVPPDRWDWQAHYGDPALGVNKTNVKWGGFIDGVADFDPLFFGISPKEAELMDPQQRLLMTHVWKAIEDAGHSAASLSGSNAALYVGTGISGYGSLIARAKVAIEGYSATGAVPSVGPNRMSYFLNIHGPSEPVETACSSSLVALRKGVLAIERGEADLAIVGGVQTMVTPDLHISFSKAGMLSEDGRCKAFSDRADGYVRSEGVGMLVLKRLSAAERAGDHIYGLIRGSAENHGGRATSLTAPNPKSQAALLVAAYRKAGIDPRSVGYIEAHGTGTSLGDSVEINGLQSAFREMYEETGEAEVKLAHCGLGSVKTNIGHLELAAGVAGVIKVLLQLKHKTLVKNLHCETVNPYVRLEGSPFYIVREKQQWKALQDAHGNDLPRRAGVSSFGFGGVNAHVVIEEYVPGQRSARSEPITPDNPALIILSARTEERLRAQAEQLVGWIRRNEAGDEDLADMAYTLQVGRDAMEERLALVAGSIGALQRKLDAYLAGEAGIEDLHRGQVKRNKDALAVFTADEELQEAVGKWVQRKKFSKVLDLWVKGLVFDWALLYGDAKPRRISLPTYAFARQRHWVPEAVPEGEAEAAGPEAASRLLMPVWEVVVPSAPELPRVAGRALIVGGSPRSRRELKAIMPSAEVMDLDVSASVDALTRTLQALSPIHHLIWISPSEAIPARPGESARTATSLLTCLFRWTKALLALDHGDRELTWTLVTFRAFALAADDPVDPAQSGLHGLAGSMANEYPNWQIRAIDLEDEEHLEAQPLVGIVPGPHGFPLARRHGQWRVQRLANCQVIASSVPRYKAGGVYLVIGGAGGLGEMFSEHLIRTFRAQMVWLGRRPANEVIEAKLDRLAALGPRPHYVVADAADEQGLRAAYAEVRRRFGRVDGVVHSAVGDLDSSLATMTEESFRSVLSAKIDVCVQIDRVLCQEALDFVIFFSSMVSFTRDHGKSGYAAGSLFKDAFAHELARRVPGAVKVMNWGWLGQVGIANAIPDAARKRLERQGVRAISPDEAMDALSRLLASPLQQLGCISETKDAAFLLGSLSAQASLVLPSMKSSFLGGLVERLDNLSSHGAEMSMN